MQIEELFELTLWIDEEIVQAEILQKYQALHGVVNQNAQPNQPKQPFESQQADLTESLSEVPLARLSNAQLNMLETIGISSHIGILGVTRLEELLFRNALDIANAAQKLAEIIADINRGIQWKNKIREPLEQVIDNEDVKEIADAVLIRVHFTADAGLRNLTEFKDWGKVWYDIGRGITMAHGEAPEAVQVIGASKGSVILSLITAYGIAKTVSSIILESLKISEKVLDLRKKAEEVRAMELANDTAEKALLDEAEAYKKSGIEALVKEKVDELKIKLEQDGDKVKALDTSIRKLLDFVEKGGELDFIIPEDDDDDDEENQASEVRQQLRVAFSEIRNLESKMQRIEHNPS